jgi:hypothetical protein
MKGIHVIRLWTKIQTNLETADEKLNDRVTKRNNE